MSTSTRPLFAFPGTTTTAPATSASGFQSASGSTPAPTTTPATKTPATDYHKDGGIETIDILPAKLSADQFEGFCLGNVYKYLSSRTGKKPDHTKAPDFKKAYYYLGLLAGQK
ncbi:hypothetical protein SpCBS45565_g00692 [Spizellomyces sp. 'palustris']|nr:hypothetical protein SpCBS45565_g00692 [Spizellomyces sp. 'palustris']